MSFLKYSLHFYFLVLSYLPRKPRIIAMLGLEGIQVISLAKQEFAILAFSIWLMCGINIPHWQQTLGLEIFQ